jgi:pimeloyl-ACP methyl ester carboxylesterase
MNHPWSAAYASFTRRAIARVIDLGVVVAPWGVLYLVNRGLGSPLRYTSLFNWVWPESPTMFMATDFPGIFLTFISIKLLNKGYKVISVQNPTTSLEDDVAATKRAIDRVDGDVILVGHSWGGSVITEAGADPRVKALVNIAAFAPDKGETELRWARALLPRSFPVSFRMQTGT